MEKKKGAFKKYFVKESEKKITLQQIGSKGIETSGLIERPNSSSRVQYVKKKKDSIPPSHFRQYSNQHNTSIKSVTNEENAKLIESERKNKPPLVPPLRSKRDEHREENKLLNPLIAPSDLQHLSQYKFYEDSRATAFIQSKEPFFFLQLSKFQQYPQHPPARVYPASEQLPYHFPTSEKNLKKWKEEMDLQVKKRILAVVNAQMDGESDQHISIREESP